MIQIRVRKEKGEYLFFKSRGHAGYAEEGHDIICAAVSALIITTENALDKLTTQEYDLLEKDGYVSIRFKNGNTGECRLLMDSLMLGLQEIEKTCHGKYLTVTIREV
jgi:hypothetical protein